MASDDEVGCRLVISMICLVFGKTGSPCTSHTATKTRGRANSKSVKSAVTSGCRNAHIFAAFLA